jgi:hypothetical protein
MLVTGSSGTGKSYLVAKILENVDWCYDKKIQNIYFFYSVHQPLYEILEQKLPNITFLNTLPTEELLQPLMNPDVHDLVIVDDFLRESAGSTVIEDLCVRTSHHNSISVILINQNLFYGGRNRRTQNTNSQYTIFLRNPSALDQVATFGRQRFPGRSKYFLEACADAMRGQFGYLLVDGHAQSDTRFALRTGILPGDELIVYTIP